MAGMFVDLVKAFDSVNREMIWQILAKYGIPLEPLVNVIVQTYIGHWGIDERRKSKGSLSVPSTLGVKQGHNIAPVLFLSASIQAAAESIDRNWCCASTNQT